MRGYLGPFLNQGPLPLFITSHGKNTGQDGCHPVADAPI